MKFEGETPQGEKIKLGAPIFLRLDRDIQAPADELRATFPGRGSEKIVRLKALCGEDTIFDGLVDEAESTAGSSGFLRSFVARSRAALLLDNEAKPQKYCRTSFPMLFSRHAAPYGFSSFSAPDQVFCGEFSVQKGESEWTVLDNFCRRFLNTGLTVRPDGSLYAGKEPSRNWTFGEGGTGVLSVSLKYRFCDLISEAWVQQKQNGCYYSSVQGETAIRMGIQRRRFFNFSELAYRRAQKVIEDAQRRFMTVELEIPGRVDAAPGDGAIFAGSGYGILEGLRVSRTVYTVEEGVETTRIVLYQEGRG